MDCNGIDNKANTNRNNVAEQLSTYARLLLHHEAVLLKLVQTMGALSNPTRGGIGCRHYNSILSVESFSLTAFSI